MYVWDLRTGDARSSRRRRAVHSTCLAASSSMYAAGSDSGVCVSTRRPWIGWRSSIQGLREGRGPCNSRQLARTPFKTVMSLTTRADTLRFNHDGQILAIASQMKDSLRLILARQAKRLPTGQLLRHRCDTSQMSILVRRVGSWIGNVGPCLLCRLLHYADLNHIFNSVCERCLIYLSKIFKRPCSVTAASKSILSRELLHMILETDCISIGLTRSALPMLFNHQV